MSTSILAARYLVSFRASPFVLAIAKMLHKKLGPRLQYEHEDDGLVNTVLNHRDFEPILVHAFQKLNPDYVYHKIDTSFRMSYHKDILTMYVLVLGESTQEFQSDPDSATNDLMLHADPRKAGSALEKVLGVGVKQVGNERTHRDPGDRETFILYKFQLNIPLPFTMIKDAK